MAVDIGLISHMMNGKNLMKNPLTQTKPMNNQTSFTNEELDILYDLIRDKYDVVMQGDWEVVKEEISGLHLLSHKVLELQTK